jgi:thioredoxin 1
MIQPLLAHFQAERPNQIKVIGINADENLRLANTYKLTTLPTLLVFENGQVTHRFDSFRGRDDLRRALDTILENRAQTTSSAG